jgi:hypothetical protein
MHCSIYVKDFWRRERFFKLCARMGVHRLAAGTPFASLLWRIVGVRLGKRLFDDGHMMAEKTLVTIGDDVTLNAGSYIQVHTQEDYAFKSDATTVGSGCTFGIGAMAHYAVTMGDDVVLAPDSFLMKGEEVPSGARWGGNPARELQAGDLRLPAVQSVQLTRDHHDTGDAMQIPAQRIVADAEPEGTTAPRPNGRHVARGRHREPTR